MQNPHNRYDFLTCVHFATHLSHACNDRRWHCLSVATRLLMEHETETCELLLEEHQQDHQYPPETPNENPSVSVTVQSVTQRIMSQIADVPTAIPVASWSIANDESFRSPEEGIRYPDNKRAMAKEAGGSKTVFGVRTFPDSFQIETPAGSIWLEAQEAAKANKSGGSVRVFQSADNIVDNIADAEAWIKSQVNVDSAVDSAVELEGSGWGQGQGSGGCVARSKRDHKWSELQV